MVDVQELMNENIKELMKEMTISIRYNIVDTMKTQTTKHSTNLTPMSPPEPITQSPHFTPPKSRTQTTSSMKLILKSPQMNGRHQHPQPKMTIKNNLRNYRRYV